MIDFFFFVFFYLQLIARILDFFILKIFVFSWYLFQTTYLVDLSFHNSILSVTSSTKISCLFTYFIYPTSCPCTEFYKKKNKTKSKHKCPFIIIFIDNIIIFIITIIEKIKIMNLIWRIKLKTIYTLIKCPRKTIKNQKKMDQIKIIIIIEKIKIINLIWV